MKAASVSHRPASAVPEPGLAPLVLAEGVGHFIQREAPGATAALLLEHLRTFA